MSNTANTQVTDENRAIAKTAADFFGEKSSVRKYLDNDEKYATALLSCPDSPQSGVTSYSTVGVSDYQFKVIDDELPLGVEVIGACGSSFPKYANVICSVAFAVIKDGLECYPDAVFRNAVAMNKASETMAHVLLIDPNQWPVAPATMRLDTKAVAWLQALPISELELKFLEEHGVDALKDVFVEKQIDTFDLNRASVIR